MLITSDILNYPKASNPAGSRRNPLIVTGTVRCKTALGIYSPTLAQRAIWFLGSDMPSCSHLASMTNDDLFGLPLKVPAIPALGSEMPTVIKTTIF